MSAEICPYFLKRWDVVHEDGCLFFNHKLIIPEKLRKLCLKELHSSLLGVVKMKSLARSYFWRQKLDNDIEKITSSCETYLLH